MSSSGAIGVASSLPALISSGNALGYDFTPVKQYINHQLFENRLNISDLGAYQYAIDDIVAPAAPMGLGVI